MNKPPMPQASFKIVQANHVNGSIEFECISNDIIADVKTACENGMGRLYDNGHYVLFVSDLYDYRLVYEWLNSLVD